MRRSASMARRFAAADRLRAIGLVVGRIGESAAVATPPPSLPSSTAFQIGLGARASHAPAGRPKNRGQAYRGAGPPAAAVVLAVDPRVGAVQHSERPNQDDEQQYDDLHALIIVQRVDKLKSGIR